VRSAGATGRLAERPAASPLARAGATIEDAEMPDAAEIYQFHPEDYDALVRCEDRDGNLLKAIRDVVQLQGADVVELGAGTGRLTALLAPHVRSLRAFDLVPAMLQVARLNLAPLALGNWELRIADNACLPVPDERADISVAAWTHGHQTIWNEDGWRAPIEAAIGEMIRALRPGGTAIVLETLGTDHTTPFAPPAELARYYELLSEQLHFQKTWLRTDYEFSSLAQGERLLRCFFGEEMAGRFVSRGSRVLPECTGLWWRRK
jgi:ubiquinone/menaquinone biosynthesis C-methylase UbiE